jgi:ribosome maturation factor RimP
LDTNTEKIFELAQQCASSHGVFVVDVEIKHTTPMELWVYLDKEDVDLSIDVCTKISRELGFLLEAHDIEIDRYRLNVSSPGLSRPLSDIRQYPKNIGRTCRVRYRKNDAEVEKVMGQLSKVDSANIQLMVEDKSIKIPFVQIIEAKIIPTI